MSNKSPTNKLLETAKKKSRSLIQAVKADPAGGMQWWLKTHHQEDELAEVSAAINQRCEQPEFELGQVSLALQAFTLKDDITGILDWFNIADHKLKALAKELDETPEPKPKSIQDCMKELQFIINEDQFFKELHLELLHDRISYMFDELNKRLAEANLAVKLEKEAAAQKQAIQLQKVKNMEIEEANKTVELEKQKLVAQKAKLDSEVEAKKALKEVKQVEIQRLDKVKEFQARQAEEKRAKELQGQYQSMQIQMVADDELMADLKRRIDSGAIAPDAVAQLCSAQDE